VSDTIGSVLAQKGTSVVGGAGYPCLRSDRHHDGQACWRATGPFSWKI